MRTNTLRLVHSSTTQDTSDSPAPITPVDLDGLMTREQAARELARLLRGREVWDDLDDICRQRYRRILGLLPDRERTA